VKSITAPVRGIKHAARIPETTAIFVIKLLGLNPYTVLEHSSTSSSQPAAFLARYKREVDRKILVITIVPLVGPSSANPFASYTPSNLRQLQHFLLSVIVNP